MLGPLPAFPASFLTPIYSNFLFIESRNKTLKCTRKKDFSIVRFPPGYILFYSSKDQHENQTFFFVCFDQSVTSRRIPRWNIEIIENFRRDRSFFGRLMPVIPAQRSRKGCHILWPAWSMQPFPVWAMESERKIIFEYLSSYILELDL